MDLNEFISGGEDLPVGKYVHLDVYLPVGMYARHTSETKNWLTGSSFVYDEYVYYAVLLNDATLFTIILSENEDIAAMNRIRDLVWADDEDDLSLFEPGSYRVSGKLITMRNQEVRELYEQLAVSLGFFPGLDNGKIRYEILDTTAERFPDTMIYIGFSVAALAAAVFVWRKVRKRKKDREIPSDAGFVPVPTPDETENNS